MNNWQKSTTRQAPKSKAELRSMLTEAVRNTQPDTESQRRTKARPAGRRPTDPAPISK